jgi:NADP-dependent 3-hydroxy acid dehydrogenase YdfG
MEAANLSGKIAVVTGASSGIGASIAKFLAEEGAKVAMGARREDKLKQLKQDIENRLGSKAQVVYFVTDVTKRQEVKDLVTNAEKHFGGPVSIMINNAGIMPLSFMKNVREDEWEKMVDVNIKGVLHGVGAVLPKMLERKEGDIVNISSDAGRKVFPGGTVYCSTKWAVEAITSGLRLEIAGSGVRVLSIQPGATKSELGHAIKDPEVIESGKKFANMKLLESDDVARAVVFALKQPRHASINEIMLRPEQQGQ